MPLGFATLKKMFHQQHKPKANQKAIEKRIKALDVMLGNLNRNKMYAETPKEHQDYKTEIAFRETQRDDLKAQLGNVITEDDANSIVLSVLENFSRFTLAFSGHVEATEEIKAAIQAFDKIVVFTELQGEGYATRHTLDRGEIYLFGSNINRKRKPVKNGTRSTKDD